MNSPEDYQPHVRETHTVQVKAPTVAIRSVQGSGEGISTAAPDSKPATEKPAAPPTEEMILTTLADSNSRYERIDVDLLPSRGYFYNFNALSVRKLLFPDLKKITRAQATDNFRTLVEVLNTTIDRDLFQLTTGDFWFLMYWHRVNSYLSSPLEIEFRCPNADHIARTLLPETDERYLHPKSLEGNVTLSRTTQRVVGIEDEASLVNHIAHTFETYGVALYPVRVIDLIQNMEMMDRLSGLEAMEKEIRENGLPDSPQALALESAHIVAENIDEEWLNDNASILHHKVHGATLEDRRKFLMDYSEEKGLGFEFAQALDKFIELQAHGVDESVVTNCRGCGARVESEISTPALKFFPGLL